ncbi:MAG: hypothetical protein PHY80_01010 [Rickettsiales bacterium]|nr:hypothetical protein [Rickettsiales bacterium]
MELFTVIAQLINFTVLIILLNKFLYKPILSSLDKRRDEVRRKIEETEKKLVESEQIKEKYLTNLRELEKENLDFRKKAVQEVKKFKETEIQKAKDDVATRKSKFNEYLVFEEKSLIENFNENFGELFIKYSNMILSNLANSDLETEIVNRFLEKIKLLTLHKVEEINSLKSDLIYIISNSELTLDQKTTIKQTLIDMKIKFFDIKFDVDTNLILGIEMKIKSYVLSWDIKELSNTFLSSVGKK